MSYFGYTSFQTLENNEIQFSNLTSINPVVGVATSRKGLILKGSSALLFTGFPLSGNIQTLELKLHVSRLSRVQDKTIQIWHNGSIINENVANLEANDIQTYVWNNLNIEWNENSGVVIDLQPHTQYPSANTVYIRSVDLRKIS
jgi:hypothetical protein